jgi:drug/metabolite transporter (DMT)-like permease
MLHSPSPSAILTTASMSRYVWIAVAAQFIASTIPSASKLVVDTFAVEPYIALRWSISALVFGCVLIVSNVRCTWEPRLIATVSALGIGGYVLASLGTLYAVKLAGVSFFALLTLLSPLIVVALSAAVLNERIRTSTWIALGIALGGLTLVVGGKVEVSSIRPAAVATALVIAAYTSDSLTFLYSKPFQSRLSLVQYLFVAQAAAAVSMWLASFAMYPREQLMPPTGGIWAAIVYVALVSCVGIYFVWYWLLKHLQGQQLGVLQYFHGIAAALFGVVFFDEELSWPMIAGSVLLLVSIFIASRPGPRSVVDQPSGTRNPLS